MPDETIKPLVPRRRHRNVIEAPIPLAIVGEVVDSIERRLRFVRQLTFVLEFSAGLFILYWFATASSLAASLRLWGLVLTAAYLIVVLFGRVRGLQPGRLRAQLSLLWIASTGTTIAYQGLPEVPVILAGILSIAYGLPGDRRLSKQVTMSYALMSGLWLATCWAFEVASPVDPSTVRVTILLVAVVLSVAFLSAKIAGVQAARIFGDSIAGLEDMQQALAQVHNRRIEAIRQAGIEAAEDTAQLASSPEE